MARFVSKSLSGKTGIWTSRGNYFLSEHCSSSRSRPAVVRQVWSSGRVAKLEPKEEDRSVQSARGITRSADLSRIELAKNLCRGGPFLPTLSLVLIARGWRWPC